MTLNLYNTLTRKKERFEPSDKNRVTMYVCGPTVYDYAHIGNARPVVVFDVLYRLLKHLYPDARIEYARNITDVDDKINAKGQEIVAREGGDINAIIKQITQKFENHYNEDMDALGCLRPDHTPHATDFIAQMVEIIKTLIARGHAYEAQGHVLFHVPSMKNYGKLSGRSVEEMIAGARVEVAPYKKDPADFVLWKPSSPDLPGWDSPWGRGRPGWHIECSAMSRAVLGEQIDIHGGGLDLIFPHHENEIAQSECSMCQTPPLPPAGEGRGEGGFARFWLHNGYLTVNGEKMSKSLGNFFTVRDVLKRVKDISKRKNWADSKAGEVARLAMLMTHYSQPLDWTDSRIEEALVRLDGWYVFLKQKNIQKKTVSPAVIAALEDNLNTILAINTISSLNGEDWIASANMMGLLLHDPNTWADQEQNHAFVMHISQQVALRDIHKKSKDFKKADEIRNALLTEHSIVIKDKPDGTTEWEWK